MQRPRERPAQDKDKWLDFPFHATIDMKAQRLCELGGELLGDSCGDALFGMQIADGAVTLDGACEGLLISPHTWP